MYHVAVDNYVDNRWTNCRKMQKTAIFMGVVMWIAKKALCIVIGIIGILALCALGGYVVSVMGRTFTFGTVVIDAGHGGIDKGVSYNGLYEADVNLAISKILKKELQNRGYKAVMTRDSDKALASGKKADMKARSELINNEKPDLILSIHVNNWKTPSRRGVQVFYDDTAKWRKIGESMQAVMNTYVNAKYCKRTDLASLGGDYFITKCSPYPAIIIETGFISNKQDYELLKSDNYRNDIVKSIVKFVDSMLLDSGSIII